MLDKRQWRRVDTNIGAAARFLISDQVEPVRVENVNSNGLCFSGAALLKPGEKVDITMDCKECSCPAVRTEVVWSGFFVKDGLYRTGVRLADSRTGENEAFLRFYNFLLIRSGSAQGAA